MKLWMIANGLTAKGYKGYKDGLQPERVSGWWQLAGEKNQPVSKTETKTDTKLRSLSVWVLIQECIDLKISDTVMTS